MPIAEFHTRATLQRRLRRLGPAVLVREFDDAQILANLRSQTESETGTALLNQSVMAGIGNVFKSEVCFGCGVNPFRRVATLTIQEAACLVATARKLMLANVGVHSGDETVTYKTLRRTTGRLRNEDRLWVYGRKGKPCHRCCTAIETRKQMPDARTTFWCPRCQPLKEVVQSRGA